MMQLCVADCNMTHLQGGPRGAAVAPRPGPAVPLGLLDVLLRGQAGTLAAAAVAARSGPALSLAQGELCRGR